MDSMSSCGQSVLAASWGPMGVGGAGGAERSCSNSARTVPWWETAAQIFSICPKPADRLERLLIAWNGNSSSSSIGEGKERQSTRRIRKTAKTVSCLGYFAGRVIRSPLDQSNGFQVLFLRTLLLVPFKYWLAPEKKTNLQMGEAVVVEQFYHVVGADMAPQPRHPGGCHENGETTDPNRFPCLPFMETKVGPQLG
ncbi:UNVERIFIED_CONTAM: hypothetical protein FKN15_065532 [Acipenser sinensis]